MSSAKGKGPLPWMKFNVGKWLSDQSIRTCPLSARGLLIDMLSIMHWAKPRGYLLINGVPMTVDELARSAGAHPDETGDLVRLLVARGAIAQDRRGVYYSPTMVDETKKAATAKDNGEKGGNPSLCTKKENSASDNQDDNPTDKPKRKEVRGKTKDSPPSSALRSDDLPPSSRSKRGEALPATWQLPEAWRHNAHAWGVAEAAVDRVAARFSAHWRGQGAKRADWHAAWEEWCLGHLERQQAPAAPAPVEPTAPFVEPDEPVLIFVQSRIGSAAYRSWFGQARVRWDGNSLAVLLPTAFVRQYVETHYSQHFPPATRFVFERGQA